LGKERGAIYLCVVNGTLSYVPDELDVVVSLTAGGAYHFVGFQVPAQAGKD
jgi:hypothetical protein